MVSEVKLMLGRAERELAVAQGAAGGQKIRANLRGEETLKEGGRGRGQTWGRQRRRLLERFAASLRRTTDDPAPVRLCHNAGY